MPWTVRLNHIQPLQGTYKRLWCCFEDIAWLLHTVMEPNIWKESALRWESRSINHDFDDRRDEHVAIDWLWAEIWNCLRSFSSRKTCPESAPVQEVTKQISIQSSPPEQQMANIVVMKQCREQRRKGCRAREATSIHKNIHNCGRCGSQRYNQKTF